MGGSTVPVWVALVLGVSSCVVALAAIAAAEVRDCRRLKHEREMQLGEIEEQRWSSLRDERIRAYSALTRLTKRMDVDTRNPTLPAVAEAHSEVDPDREPGAKRGCRSVVSDVGSRVVA